MRLYIDTSALTKRYVREPGTDQVIEACRRCDEILASVVCIPESVSALRRLLREGVLSRGQYNRLKFHLAQDMGQATIVPLDHPVLSRTIDAIESGPLRALDAIHVGSALVSGSELFLSADRRQAHVARKLGLRVQFVD